MAERPNQTDPMFPTLHGAPIDHLASFVPPKRASQGEILFDQGDATHGVFVVVSGSIEILGVSSGNETVRKILGPGTFTGDVNQLSGAP